MGRQYDTITGAELLRADFCSQKILVSKETGASEALVTEKQFWGDYSQNEKLYYDFKEPDNKGWTVEQSGWNDYSKDDTKHMNSTQTEIWIENNALCENDSTITIIQGYAGCGKTIFVNSLLRKAASRGTSVVNYDIYVDYDNNSLEDGYLALSIRNHLIKQLIQCLIREDGYELYERYRDLLTAYAEESSASFSNVLSIFREGGIISTLAKQVFDARNDPELIKKREKTFARQFISASVAMTGALKYKYREDNEKRPSFQSLLGLNNEYIRELLKNYTAMDFILLCAICEMGNEDRAIVFYDNLDIIDNPYHVAIFVSELRLILSKIKMTLKKPDYNIPVFNVIIAVRKITYSFIGSFSEVRSSEYNLNAVQPSFLDISNLYSPVKILKHKAKILYENLDSFIPVTHQKDNIKSFLKAMIRIPEATLDSIGLSPLFNHNIRACANVLECAMRYSDEIVPKEINIQKMTDRCTYSIWIHNICAVLHEKGVWRDLGFNTENGTIEFYPAALSRLILTYLFNRRRGFSLGKEYYCSIEVPFDEIVHTFEKMPFLQRPYPNMKRNQIQTVIEENYSLDNSREIIVDVISNMLKRNSRADGINPRDEMELWRRPIYYTRNAFPLTDNSGNDYVKKALGEQLAQMDNQNAKLTSFCITDEGYEFIERIVTNFEFFSIRSSGRRSKPLCYILNERQLNNMIRSVYSQVENYVGDHLWLMKFYINHYGKSKGNLNDSNYQKDVDEYLGKEFHSKTDRFYPQLHVVRTIFDHIYTINDYRDYLILEKPKDYEKLNKTLVTWIGLYLELYRKQLFNVLEGTIGSFNETFLDLKYLYWRIYREKDSSLLPKDDNDKVLISVNRTTHPHYRLTSKLKISDEILKTDPMLL